MPLCSVFLIPFDVPYSFSSIILFHNEYNNYYSSIPGKFHIMIDVAYFHIPVTLANYHWHELVDKRISRCRISIGGGGQVHGSP